MFNIVSPVLGAIVGFGANELIRWWGQRVYAGKLDNIRKSHAETFELITKTEGDLANIRHYIDHISSGETVIYPERCKKRCMQVRESARNGTTFVGWEFVQAVTRATDAAMKYAD